MPVKMTWENEAKTVVRFDLIGRWTWAEFRAVILKAVYETATDKRPYTVIVHFSNETYMPMDLLSIANQAYEITPENLKTLIVVSPNNNFVLRVGEVFTRINSRFRDKYKFTHSLDEAHRMAHVHQTAYQAG